MLLKTRTLNTCDFFFLLENTAKTKNSEVSKKSGISNCRYLNYQTSTIRHFTENSVDINRTKSVDINRTKSSSWIYYQVLKEHLP